MRLHPHSSLLLLFFLTTYNSFVLSAMSLINWNSWTPSSMDRIERRMNQLANHLYQDFQGGGGSSFWSRPFTSSEGGSNLGLPVNIYEMEKSWAIHAEIPGVKKEDIKLDVNNDAIIISGETKMDKDYTKDNIRYQERREGKFSRTLSLPDNVDRDKISAKFENGVLHVDMPKTLEAKPARKIAVQ
ncbi:HSP20-like chaperone [Zychaea mexicana]|uniref:HSP20-like chaperone n=1 Tax=Zychaea mexicana TaxID=64656 RepID=UPI0022FED9CB|nr:HSP20-like chaperone [Zychaea mexicana]KAI9498080.1 HSP20-like chaperone [Zychaea mexicana]